MKRIAISGAGGFLGRHILNEIIETSHIVYALTSKPSEIGRELKDEERVIFIHKDKYADVPWEEIDVLINCAFPRNTDGTMMADGLNYIKNLLTFAVEHGVKSVINISSQSVYSQKRKEAATEETPLDLETKYAVGKYATELLTSTICKQVPYSNIRLASLIGIGFEQRVVNKLVRQAFESKEVYIKVGNQKFGFLDVRDAVEGILKFALSESKLWQKEYNFGAEQIYTLDDIADVVSKVVERYSVHKIDIHRESSNDELNSELDSKMFYEQCKWKPKYTLENSVEKICDGIIKREWE